MADVNVEWIRSVVTHFLVSVLIVAVIFEACSFFCWLGLAGLGKNNLFSLILGMESQLFYSLAILAPIFVLFWMFSWIFWPLRVFLHIQRNEKRKKKAFFDEFIKTIRLALDKMFRSVESVGYLDSRILMATSFVLVVLITAYPYLPSLNPLGNFVGVDTPYYEKQLFKLNLLDDFCGVFLKVFSQSPDRPLSLLLLFIGWKMTWFSARQVVEFSPVLLGLLLVIATYFFARQVGFNRFYASLTMLFSAFSYHVTVGMYGALLANWLGLVFLYFFEGFIFLGLKKNSWRFCVMALVFQSLLLFSHANTWDMSMGILSVFFLVVFLEWLVKHKNSCKPLMLFVIIIVGVSLNVLRNLALGVGPGTVEAIGVAKSSVSWVNVENLWQTLILSLGSYMGISFMNPISLFLAGLGGLAVAFDTRLVSRFFTVCLTTSSIPFILGNQVVQTRILYNLPVHVFSIFGLLVLLEFVKQLVKDEKNKERIELLLVLLVVFLDLNYALRCSFYLTQIIFFPAR